MSECTSCAHCHPIITEGESLVEECRRYPPQVFILEGEFTQSFPNAGERCGEFKADLDSISRYPLSPLHKKSDE